MTLLDTDPELLPVDAPFAVERNLTRLHRAHAQAHPALREAFCLQAQFPAAFQAIRPGDCFAGRWQQAAIVCSAKPAGPMLLGYSCEESRLRQEMAGQPQDVQADLEDCIAYWQQAAPALRLRAAYPDRIAERLPQDDWQSGQLPAYPLYRLAGLQLDFRKLLQLGLPGLRALVERRGQDGMDPDLAEAWLLSLDIVTTSALHFAAQADALAETWTDAQAIADARRIAASCRAITQRAPRGLHEALQLVVLYKTIATVENWARMDDYAGPFLCDDLDAGRLEEAEALRMLLSLWRFMAETGAIVNERVIIGGCGRQYPRQADRFARLAIAATREHHDILPQLSLRLHPDQDPDLYQLALDALAEGCTFPILYDDAVNVAAVQRAFCVDRVLAEQWLPFGCGEYVLDHRSVGTPSGIINSTLSLG